MIAKLWNKWAQDGSPDAGTREVAAKLLQERFAAVIHYLHRAAQPSEQDTVDVHQVRVWSRRAAAAMRLFAGLLPTRLAHWLRKQLRRIRRAANDARNCDVLTAHLKKTPDRSGNNHWIKSVSSERRRAKLVIEKVHAKLMCGNRFSRRVTKLLARVLVPKQELTPTAEPHFGVWARIHLKPIVDDFFAAASSLDSDENSLHRLRICAKKLRYTMEVVATAFPTRFRNEVYAAVQNLQDRLGDINDLVTTREQLRKKKNRTRSAGRMRQLKELLHEEEACLQQATADFHSRCTAESLRWLRQQFDDVLEGSEASAFATKVTINLEPSNGARTSS